MADVQINSVTKSFGDNGVIHSVDLKVEDNEFMDFVGPSGCGKSTLLRLIAGLEDVNEGEISIGGEREVHGADEPMNGGTERQAVLIELTRNRECRSAIEIKRDGESLQGRRVIFIHGAI